MNVYSTRFKITTLTVSFGILWLAGSFKGQSSLGGTKSLETSPSTGAYCRETISVSK